MKKEWFVLWSQPDADTEKGKGQIGHSEEPMTKEEAVKVRDQLQRDYGDKVRAKIYRPKAGR